MHVSVHDFAPRAYMTDELRHSEFLTMLEQCHSMILRVCMVYADRDPDRIKDLYQDIICNLWKMYPRFEGGSSAKTWVYSIALNTAHLQYRTSSRRPRLVGWDDCPGGMVEELCADPEDGDDEVARLYRLIDLLDQEDRTILFLYIDRVPQHEIGKILNMSDLAVRMKIHHLKQKLKKMNENEKQ